MRREISLSETIQLTLIRENKEEQQKINVTHDSGMTLMTTLLQKELITGNFCGGRGTCGRCRVQFLQSAPLPTSRDRQAFTPDELRLGYRLACMAKPGNDCVVRMDFIKPRELEIVTEICDVVNVSEKNDCLSQEKEEGIHYLAAVDLGTTTIAMQLMEMESGRVADTYCAMNPQRSYGADVLSRIQAANERPVDERAVQERAANTETVNERTAGAADIMRNSVWKVIEDGLNRFWAVCHEKNPEAALCCMCIAGNTTMEHLLMGLSTKELGKSPFLPVELGLQRCVVPIGDAAQLPVYVAPGISAFVGGDIVTGLYRLKMLPLCGTDNERPRCDTCSDSDGQQDGFQSGGVSLLIDLGTNGEMAITDGRRMVVTATAAGPAFEGGPGKTAAGSDMVAMTALLLKEGIIDETGLMADPYFEEGITVSGHSGASIHLTQKDIRALQMAKAAVRAGVEILHQKMGCPFVERVWLAGGFGYYLDVDAAIAIGLLPREWKSCTKAAGNTSLAGAFEMGADLWNGKLTEEALSEMMQGIESINLAEQPEFEALYIRYMTLKSF